MYESRHAVIDLTAVNVQGTQKTFGFVYFQRVSIIKVFLNICYIHVILRFIRFTKDLMKLTSTYGRQVKIKIDRIRTWHV